MNLDKPIILYLDDEEHNLIGFKAAFRREYTIHTATNGRIALQILRENEIHMIITDQRMPQMTGVQFLEAVIPEFPDPIRMILTGFSDVESIIKAINSGRVYRYLTKPWDETELRLSINGAIEHLVLQQKNRELLGRLEEKLKEQERIMNLFRKYVPETVLNEILNADEEQSIFDGETRIISVLFSDIRSFTALSSSIDAKLVIALLNDYFTIMTECVVKYKGTVNKFIGDGLFAMFGAPVSYIENQHNAVNSALAMRECLDKINNKYEPLIGKRIEIGIGIHTGEVIVGNIGSENRIEYTAIGDTVNLTSRIESLTKSCPNGILISEATYEAVNDSFEVKAWEPVEVKGKTERINVFEVLGSKV